MIGFTPESVINFTGMRSHPWIRRRRRRAPPRTKATRSGRAPPRSRAPARATQNLFIVKFPTLSLIVYTQQPTDSPAESEKKPTTDPAGSAFSLTLFPKKLPATAAPLPCLGWRRTDGSAGGSAGSRRSEKQLPAPTRGAQIAVWEPRRNPRTNPAPEAQRLSDVEILQAFHDGFACESDEINFIDFTVAYEGPTRCERRASSEAPKCSEPQTQRQS